MAASTSARTLSHRMNATCAVPPARPGLRYMASLTRSAAHPVPSVHSRTGLDGSARIVVTRASTLLESSGPKAVTVSVPNYDKGGHMETSINVADGSQVLTVELKKPLGLVLTERGGRAVVDDVTSGGHAAAAGVRKGDIVLATTARTQAKPGDLKDPLVLFLAANETFKTLSTAIKSNTCSQCPVALVLERPAGAQQ